MKRLWLILGVMGAFGLMAWAGLLFFGNERRLEAAAAAAERWDFQQSFAFLDDFLSSTPGDGILHLRAASLARQAELIDVLWDEPIDRQTPAERHLLLAETAQAPADGVALERLLMQAQHTPNSQVERLLDTRRRVEGAHVALIYEALAHGNLTHLRLDRARACVEALLAARPDHALALVWRGRIHDQLNQAGAARADYEAALTACSTFDPARYFLAESLLRAEQPAAAEMHLVDLQTRLSGSLLVRLAYAECRAAVGDAKSAADLLDSWLTDAPPGHSRRTEALTARARAALTLDDAALAETFARCALERAPQDQYALHALARALYAQGRQAEAVTVAAKQEEIQSGLRAIKRELEQAAAQPADAECRYRIGETFLRLGRPVEASVWLQAALERAPNHTQARDALAKCRRP